MRELPQETIERLSRVTKLLKTQRTLPAKLEAVVAMAKRTVPNCDAAGISLRIEGEPTSVAVSDRLAVEVDLVQYKTGDGPCLAAMAEGNVVRVDVLERDSRFVRFAPGALDLNLHSVLSVPLDANGRTVGALNLYSQIPNVFDDRTEQSVRPLAEYAAEVISTSPLYAYSLEMVEGLLETMESQSVIDQAAGVLMATESLASNDALDRLRELALASGESMRAVADRVVRELPSIPWAGGKDPS